MTTQQLADYAALADQSYRRNDVDQPIKVDGYKTVDDMGDISGLRYGSNGYYYGDPARATQTGFVGQVYQKGSEYIIVFRGTDGGDVEFPDIVNATVTYLGSGTTTNNPAILDQGDMNSNANLGLGNVGDSTNRTQLTDAVALTQAAIDYITKNGGDANNITVVGQSLGGGLAGLIGGIFDLYQIPLMVTRAAQQAGLAGEAVI